MSHRVLFLSLSVLAVAACANTNGLAPQLQGRDPAALESTQSLKGIPLSSAAWPGSDWWRQLGDPQLDALIDEALRDNPGLDAADARVRALSASVLGAEAARYPTVGAKASSNGTRIPESVIAAPTGGSYSTLDMLALNFNYSFDLWGGKRAAWEAALGARRAGEVDARAARLELSVSVARTYSRLAHAYEALDIARSDRERAEQLLRLTRQRFDAGIDSQAQARQSEATLASAEQRLVQSTYAVESLQRSLAVLLGKSPDRGLGIVRPQPLHAAGLAVPADLPANLIGRRPDLVAARWQVEAASRGIDAAKAEFYPNVNISAAVGLASLHASDLFQMGSRYAQFAPAISLPIFDAGRLRAGLSARDADYDLAVARYNQVLVQSVGEVVEQVNSLRSIAAQMQAEQHAVDASREAWSLSEQRFRKGVGSYLEVLNAKQVLLANELQFAALRNQQIDVSIQLVQALGGGFHDPSSLPRALPRDGVANPNS